MSTSKNLWRFSIVAVMAIAAVAWTTPAFAAAADTYKSKCAMCHGADGKSSAIGQKMGAHDFSSAEVQGQSDAQLTETISKGKGKMPGYEKSLSAADIKGLVAYVRELGKK